MQDDEQQRREMISALADGQLDDGDIVRTMAWVASSQEARATWHAYHVLGDALRSADLVDCRGDRDFVARLRGRLVPVDVEFAARAVAVAQEGGAARAQAGVAVVADARTASANDAVVRWKWLAAAASMMAVSVLGWHLGQLGSRASAQLAATPAAGTAVAVGGTPASNDPPVMLRDPRLDELLAAHRRFGGTSALQMPAGFLRNATFEQPGR